MSITSFFTKKKTTINDEDIAQVQALKKQNPEFKNDLDIIISALKKAQELVFSKRLSPTEIQELLSKIEELKIIFEIEKDFNFKKTDIAIKRADILEYVEILSKKKAA